MAFSVETKGIAEKVFDSFKKVTPTLIAISVASTLVLFLPESILAKMSLNNLDDKWKQVIGITLIVSVSLIVAIILVTIKTWIDNKLTPVRFRKKKRKEYINLSASHKAILKQALNSSQKTIRLNPSTGDTLYLLNNHFIHQTLPGMIFDQGGNIESQHYVPEPWLIDLFNKEPSLFD